MVYVGMDVHRKRTQVAILDESGRELTNRNVTNDAAEIAKVLQGLEPGTQVAFEAGYGWSWLAELLEDLHLEAHLAHPRGCKAIASARLKNDKVDARMLAHLLRTDLLAEAWIAPPEVRDLRACCGIGPRLFGPEPRQRTGFTLSSRIRVCRGARTYGRDKDGSGFRRSTCRQCIAR
jgi:transposase